MENGAIIHYGLTGCRHQTCVFVFNVGRILSQWLKDSTPYMIYMANKMGKGCGIILSHVIPSCLLHKWSRNKNDAKVSLFEHVIYSSTNLHCAIRPGPEQLK